MWDDAEMSHSKTGSNQSVMFPGTAPSPHPMESMGLEAVISNCLKSGELRASVVASPYDS